MYVQKVREKIRGNTKRKQNNNRYFLTLVEKIIKTNLLRLDLPS